MKDCLRAMAEAIGQFMDEHPDDHPSSGSQLEREGREFDRAEVMQAFLHGGFLIQIIGDQLTAFTKTITEPVETIAPWTIVRSLLESAALSAWLLDPNIDAKTRVHRSFMHRAKGLDEQVKFARSVGRRGVELDFAVRKLTEVEAEGAAWGFARAKDGPARRTNLVSQMPGATTIIETVFGDEATYRLLSAFVHGHSWALSKLAFSVADDEAQRGAEDGVVRLRKSLKLDQVAWLMSKVASCFARPVWFRSQLLGSSIHELAIILENGYDGLMIKNEGRFWRAGLARE